MEVFVLLLIMESPLREILLVCLCVMQLWNPTEVTILQRFFKVYIDDNHYPPMDQVKKLDLNKLNSKTYEQVLNKVRTIIRAKKKL